MGGLLLDINGCVRMWWGFEGVLFCLFGLLFSLFQKERWRTFSHVLQYDVLICLSTPIPSALLRDVMMNMRLTSGLHRSSHQHSTGMLSLSLSIPHAHPSSLPPLPNIAIPQVRTVPSHGVVAYSCPIPRPCPDLLPTPRHPLWTHIHRHLYRRPYPPRLPFAPIPRCGWKFSES